jgi:hypothetical protein
MIYLLAVILPPLGLLLNGQPFAAIFNLILIVPCILLGFIFPGAFLVPSVHAVIAVYMKREDRKHRELVNGSNGMGRRRVGGPVSGAKAARATRGSR